jgi:hypothetical protein
MPIDNVTRSCKTRHRYIKLSFTIFSINDITVMYKDCNFRCRHLASCAAFLLLILSKMSELPL